MCTDNEKMSAERRPESSNSSSEDVSENTNDNRSQRTRGRSFETSKSHNTTDGATGKETNGEAFMTSDIGSPDRQREMAGVVDLDHGTGMAGYVGKMSGMSWLQRVHEYLVGIIPHITPDLSFTNPEYHAIDAANLTYFMDDENLLEVDEEWVQPQELPPWQLALVLSEAYFHSMQGAFCFVDRNGFYPELTASYQRAASGKHPTWDDRKYLAMANMMWSVGAKWLELTGLNQRPASHFGVSSVPQRHLLYYARARALGLDHRMQLDHPTFALVQGMGILAFHLMANGSIQR